MKIGVIGDILSDQYVLGEMTRFAPEGGQPVFRTQSSFIVPGGAANTKAQLRHWGAQSELFGCHCGTKRRFYSDGHYVFRQDIEMPASDAGSVAAVEGLCGAMAGLDAVIISDYDKGTLTEASVRQVIEACKANDVLCISDPKSKQPGVFSGSTIKCNSAYLERHGQLVAGTVVTNGAKTPYIVNHGNCREMPTVNAVSVVGAGDCFVAAMTVGLCRGMELLDAAQMAYSAGRIYVQRQYNMPVHPLEVAIDMNGCSGKVTDADTLKSYLEIAGKDMVFTNGCFDILHPGHLHTLAWAKSQGGILVVGVNTDDSMAAIKRKPTITCRDRCNMLASLSCVDFVVPFSDRTPVVIMTAIGVKTIVKGPDYAGREGSVPRPEGCEVLIAPPGPYTSHTTDLLGAYA